MEWNIEIALSRGSGRTYDCKREILIVFLFVKQVLQCLYRRIEE